MRSYLKQILLNKAVASDRSSIANSAIICNIFFKSKYNYLQLNTI